MDYQVEGALVRVLLCYGTLEIVSVIIIIIIKENLDRDCGKILSHLTTTQGGCYGLQ